MISPLQNPIHKSVVLPERDLTGVVFVGKSWNDKWIHTTIELTKKPQTQIKQHTIKTMIMMPFWVGSEHIEYIELGLLFCCNCDFVDELTWRFKFKWLSYISEYLRSKRCFCASGFCQSDYLFRFVSLGHRFNCSLKLYCCTGLFIGLLWIFLHSEFVDFQPRWQIITEPGKNKVKCSLVI